MKKLLFIATLTIVPLLVCADELWERAVAQFSKNTGWIAGRTEIITENLNRKGEVRSVERRLTHSRAAPGGGVESEIIHAERNGKDVTAEERRKEEKERHERRFRRFRI